LNAQVCEPLQVIGPRTRNIFTTSLLFVFFLFAEQQGNTKVGYLEDFRQNGVSCDSLLDLRPEELRTEPDYPEHRSTGT